MCDESVNDYIRRFCDTKNRCFSVNIAEKDLADLAFNDLHPHIKKRLEGYDFFTVTLVHQRSLAIESWSKESQETHRHHRCSMHTLECNSDCSDDESKDVYAAESFGHPKPNLILVLLSQLTKIGKKRNLVLMYPSVKKYLMNCIRMNTLRWHILYCRLRS